ncbi:MAG: hypothetical protein J5863_06075, partial [Desulfovibrio sp.]|nr:hypothetical protein [Desulfovibrio sp.]
DKVEYTSHTDTRDGIPIRSLFTKYVIITDKVQTNVGESNQHVITIPNNQIYNNIGIGRAYKKLHGPFAIGKQCNAYIYEKIKVFDDDEINEYLRSFPSTSVKWPNKPTNNEIENMKKILYIN